MITKIKDFLKKISVKKEDMSLESSTQDVFFDQDNYSLQNTE
jgi:copper chaperone CopZ